MNDFARFSVKGQIVIPKTVRDHYAFRPGDIAEIVQTPEGVLLRKPATHKAASVAEGLAALRAAVHYDGPWIDESEWAAGIAETIREKWGDHRA